jgi:hypothetical protein
MSLMCMHKPVDPRTIHSPKEEPMLIQACNLAGQRINDKSKEIKSGLLGVGYAVYNTWVAMATLKATAVKAVLCKAALTHTAVTPQVVATIAAKITAKSALSTAGAVSGAIGAAGAIVIAEQTGEWGYDVYNAYQGKKAYLAQKEGDIKKYDAFMAKKEAESKTFLGKTKNLFGI